MPSTDSKDPLIVRTSQISAFDLDRKTSVLAISTGYECEPVVAPIQKLIKKVECESAGIEYNSLRMFQDKCTVIAHFARSCIKQLCVWNVHDTATTVLILP